MPYSPRALLGWPAVIAALAASAAPAAGAAAPWTSAALDSVLRPVFINTMTDRYIAGAAVSVVKDGRVVYAQGFGRREVFHEKPVNAETTIFRIGSVTKVLTGVAVMQLVDAGRVALDDDVDTHLRSLRVPDAYGAPVRVRHLLTHTAGFDQLGTGRHADTAAGVLPLAEFLRGNLVRIRPPGRLAVYDTYGITLAGLIVEDVGGMPYADYLQQRVFEPLDMRRTCIDVPVALRDDVAVGYGFAGEWEAMPWEYMNTAPASSVNSTVTDMARLAIALLDGGVCDGARILSRESAGAMLTPQFSNDEHLPGYGYTLWEDRRFGIPAMSHGGSMEGFGCLLYLVPGERLGVFVACNQESATLEDAAVSALLHAFLPARIHAPGRLPSRAGVDLSRFTGTFADAMHNHTRPERGGWKAKPFTITAAGDSALVVDGHPARPVGRLLFQRDDGALLVFQEDDAGRIARLLAGHSVFERASPRQ